MIRIQIDNTQLNARIRKQILALNSLPKETLDEMRRLTPIDTGNARRRTRLENNNKIIHADYPYAERLDQNWSRQTRGLGIIKPLIKWFEKQIKQIARIK